MHDRCFFPSGYLDWLLCVISIELFLLIYNKRNQKTVFFFSLFDLTDRTQCLDQTRPDSLCYYCPFATFKVLFVREVVFFFFVGNGTQ